MSSIILIVLLIVVGLAAASKKVIEMAPGMKDTLKFLTDSERWIGLTSMLIGVIYLVRFLRYISLIKYNTMGMLLMLVASLTLIILGLLLAQGILKEWFAGKEGATGFVDKMTGIFEPFRQILGLVSLALAVLAIIFMF